MKTDYYMCRDMVEFVNDPMQNWLLKNSSAAQDLSLQGQIVNNYINTLGR